VRQITFLDALQHRSIAFHRLEKRGREGLCVIVMCVCVRICLSEPAKVVQ